MMAESIREYEARIFRDRARRIGRPAKVALLLALGVLLLGAAPIMRARTPAALAAPRDPFRTLLARSRDLGPLPVSQSVSFLALTRDPSAARQAADIASIYDRHSKAFGHYGTPRRLPERAASASQAALSSRAFLRRAGIAASWQPGSSWLRISGPASAIERVFHVGIHAYVAASGRRYYAAAHDPIVPQPLTGLLAGVGRILSYPDRTANTIPVAGLRVSDLLTAYDLTPLHTRHFNGSGETIAFIEIDAFDQRDLDAFTQRFGLPSMHPVIAAGGKLQKVEGEADLDLEVAHEIAPAARLVVYNCGNCSSSDLIQLESQAVQANPRGIISISLGGCETAEGSQSVYAESNVFTRADELGESVLVASGDSGAFTCLGGDWGATPSPQYIGVSSPASEPGVTAVGGTSLDLHANSTWYREEAWQNAGATAGSGGGMSAYFARPSWQRGPGTVNAYDPNNHREVPDVSADADPLTGAQIVINGQLTQGGGTSQAAPIWAGMMALIDQYLRKHGRPVAGFLNPALYSLAATRPAYPPLHDMTMGNNLVYPATSGYDLATGLGTPDAWNLARDLLTYEGGQ